MAKRTGLQISAAGTTETAQLVMFVPTSVVSVLQFEALSFRKIRSDSRNTTAHFEEHKPKDARKKDEII
ncbi:hypothetical protein ACLKA7_004575 [Drosophila subpalustris]